MRGFHFPKASRMRNNEHPQNPLDPWMKFTLRFAAIFNALAGLTMLVGYHETYQIIGMNKPDLSFPIQLVGILVALFGLGYHLVANNPVENRNLLLIGCLSKGLGSVLGLTYVFLGRLPLRFLPVLFFADIIYLPLFLVIMRKLYRIAAEKR